MRPPDVACKGKLQPAAQGEPVYRCDGDDVETDDQTDQRLARVQKVEDLFLREALHFGEVGPGGEGPVFSREQQKLHVAGVPGEFGRAMKLLQERRAQGVRPVAGFCQAYQRNAVPH
jgi:hypothetical protein